jgi:hypothetical protein
MVRYGELFSGCLALLSGYIAFRATPFPWLRLLAALTMGLAVAALVYSFR